MDDELKKSLLLKREQAQSKLKQLEADIYFFQGYIRSIDELLAPPKDSLTFDDLKQLTGAQSIDVVENEKEGEE